MRSGDAHCDRELAVAVELVRREEEEKKMEKKEKEKQPLIESDNPHLASGKKVIF